MMCRDGSRTVPTHQTNTAQSDKNPIAPMPITLYFVCNYGFNAVPHSMQNFAPAWIALPHLGQAGGLSEVPHSLQNFAPRTVIVPHLGHALPCGCVAPPDGAAGAWAGCGCKVGV